jgi:hypothetical protein
MSDTQNNLQIPVKKHFLEYGTRLTNGVKIIGAFVLLGVNAYYLIFQKRMMTVEEQKSLLFVVGFIEAGFLGIDVSLIFQNIFNKL